MLIREDGSIVGTIGGGMVERKVIEQALEALSEKGVAHVSWADGA